MSKKDQTVVGITGKPVPKPRTAKQRHELEKKRRQRKHLGTNVGGVQYSADVNPYYNPRERTFREFIELAEGKKKKDKNIPPNAVPGTYEETPEGSRSYTLQPGKPFKKPPSKKDIFKLLNQQGGIGGKAIRKAYDIKEVTLGAGETYGSPSYQKRREKEKEEAKQKRRQEMQQSTDAARNAFRRGDGIISYEKDPETGKVVRGRRTKDGFTPDP
jgi:hypothetical protein